MVHSTSFLSNTSNIYKLKRVRPFISTYRTAIKIHKGLIEQHFDYYSAVWGWLVKTAERENFRNYKITFLELLLYQTDTNSKFLLQLADWDTQLSVRMAKHKQALCI